MGQSIVLDWDKVLPAQKAVFYQEEWPQYRERYGVPLAKQTMANRLCRGDGPRSFKINGKRAFLRADLVEFLNNLTASSRS